MTSEHRLRNRFIESRRDDHGYDPPSQWAICGGCRGEGHRAVEALRTHAFTQEEIAEMGDEWFDFVEDYRNGVYDEACSDCGGTGKVKEFIGEAADQWQRWIDDEYETRAIQRAESGYAW